MVRRIWIGFHFKLSGFLSFQREAENELEGYQSCCVESVGLCRLFFAYRPWSDGTGYVNIWLCKHVSIPYASIFCYNIFFFYLSHPLPRLLSCIAFICSSNILEIYCSERKHQCALNFIKNIGMLKQIYNMIHHSHV